MIEYCFETVNWSPYFGCERPDLRAMIRAAAANGYRWISFDIPSVACFVAHDGSLETLKAELSVQGVGLLALHSLAIDNNVETVADLAEAAIAICSALGARYLHAGITAPVDHCVVAATRLAGTRCHAAGIGFAVEFLPFLPVASIGQARALLQQAGIGGRNLVVDSWHFFNGPDDWPALEGLTAAEIAYVQFNDHPPLASDDLLFETTQKRVLPGAGCFDLERFAATLRGLGFDGVVGPEILSAHTRAQSLDQAAREFMAASSPYWK